MARSGRRAERVLEGQGWALALGARGKEDPYLKHLVAHEEDPWRRDIKKRIYLATTPEEMDAIDAELLRAHEAP